jgi:hypothetical protein
VKTLDELTMRFCDGRTSVEECHGLLSRLAHDAGHRECAIFRCHTARASEVIEFLAGLGNEATTEPDEAEELRSRARIILVRHYVSSATEWASGIGTRHVDHPRAISRLCWFYAADERHVPRNERDLANVHAFLKAVLLTSDSSLRKECGENTLHTALVRSRSWDLLREHQVFGAIPLLYETLGAMVPAPEPRAYRNPTLGYDLDPPRTLSSACWGRAASTVSPEWRQSIGVSVEDLKALERDLASVRLRAGSVLLRCGDARRDDAVALTQAPEVARLLLELCAIVEWDVLRPTLAI